MFWFLVVFALSLVVSFALMPKPESRPPAGLGDFNVPTAEVGREIPVLFGTRELKGPNVVWYGHLRVVPIKKKGGKK
jgi:hypothetical protein